MKNKFFNKIRDHASCIMHPASILLLMLVTMSVGEVCAQELFSCTFSSLASGTTGNAKQTISQTIDGCQTSFISANAQKPVTWGGGNGLNFGGQNANTSTSFHGIAIKVSGVRGLVQVKINDSYSSGKAKYKYAIIESNTIATPSSLSEAAQSQNAETQITISQKVNSSDVVVYIGEASTSYTTINSIIISTSKYAYRGSDDNNWANKSLMTVSEDGFYEYHHVTTQNVRFLVGNGTSDDAFVFNRYYVTREFNGTNISNMAYSGNAFGSDNCGVYDAGGNYYVLVYYPNTTINTTNSPIICASTTLPNDAPAPPAVTEYVVAGNGSGNWLNGSDWSNNADANQMDYAGGVWSKTYSNVPAGEYQFKLCVRGSWENAIAANTIGKTLRGVNTQLLDAGGNDHNFTFTTVVAGDITISYDGSEIKVVAPAAPTTYTVTYAANGGTGTMSDATQYAAGDQVTILTNTFTAPTGKQFASWSVKDASANTIQVTDGKFTMPSSNVTVTAQWEDVAPAPTACFSMVVKNQATTGANIDLSVGKDLELLSGGSVSQDGLNANVKDKGLQLGNSADYIAITLSDATLVQGSKIIVTYNNGTASQGVGFCPTTSYPSWTAGTNCLQSSTTGAHTDQEFTVPAGSPLIGKSTFYVFRTGSNSVYLSKLSVTNCGDALSTYSITYNCDGATSGCPENLTEQTNLPNPLPEAPFKLAYKFLGWFTNSGKTDAAVAGAAISENTTLYAKWSGYMQTQVTLDKNGGTNGSTQFYVPYGSEADASGFSAPTKAGATFDGYWDGEGGTGTKYFNADGTAAKRWDIEAGNVTLYAKWTPNNFVLSATLTNASAEPAMPSEIAYGSGLSCTITAADGYVLPSEITVTGATLSSWSSETGALEISNVTGAVTITIVAVRPGLSDQHITGNYNYVVSSVQSISLTALATGTVADYTTYTWYKGNPAEGGVIVKAESTAPTFTKNPITMEDAGTYYCQIKNGEQVVTANYIIYVTAANCDGKYDFAFWPTRPSGAAEHLCFDQVENGKPEYKTGAITVPLNDKDYKFWVGKSGYPYDNNLGSSNSKSVETYFRHMPIVYQYYDKESSSLKWGHLERGSEETFSHADEGAYGYIQIADNSSDNNLWVGFLPQAYILSYGTDGGQDWASFQMTKNEQYPTVWTSNVMELAEGLMSKKMYVGLQKQAEFSAERTGAYITNWSTNQTVNTIKKAGTSNITNDVVTAGTRGFFRTWIDTKTDANNGQLHFVPTYRIIYHANYPAGESPADTYSEDVAIDARASLSLAAAPVAPAGYVFAGWNGNAAGTANNSERLTAGSEYNLNNPTSNVELYAVWTALPAPDVTWTGVPATVYAGGKYSFTVSTNSDATLNASQLTATGTASLTKTLNGSTITINFTMAADAAAAPSFTWDIPLGTNYSAIQSHPAAITLGECTGGGGEDDDFYVAQIDERNPANKETKGGTWSGNNVQEASNNITINDIPYWKFGSSGGITINIAEPNVLAIGDIITCTVTANQNTTTGIKFGSHDITKSLTQNTVDQITYTIAAEDGIVGTRSLLIARSATNGDKIRIASITVTRSGSGSGSGEKQTANLAWNTPAPEATVNKTVGDANFTYTAASNNSIGAVSYSSSATGVATVNATNGEVTIVATGDAVITATLAEVGCFNSNSVSYNLHVESNCTAASLTIDAASKNLTLREGTCSTTLSKTAGANTSSVVYGVYSNAECTEAAANATIEGTTLTCTSAGTYYVKATQVADATYCETESNVLTIVVDVVHVTGIALNQTSVTLMPGETVQLTATVAPDDAANKSVNWTSSNDTKAPVSSTGLVSAKATGNFTITATTTDGGLTATCAVTIAEPASPEGEALTWTFPINSDVIPVVATSKTSTISPIENSTMTELATTTSTLLKGSQGSKTGYTAKLIVEESYNADNYYYVQFDVPAGREFTPSAVELTFQTVSSDNVDYSLALTDGNVTKTSSEWSNIINGVGAKRVWTVADAEAMTGTVKLKIYAYGDNVSKTAFRLGANLKIYGTLSEPAITYDITYLPGTNGTGEIAAGHKIDGVDFTLSSEKFTREGYVQTGWTRVEEGAQEFALGDTYTEDAAITLYPAWAKTYNLTVVDSENSCELGQNDIKVGDNVTVTYTCGNVAGKFLAGFTASPEVGGNYDAETKTFIFTMPASDVTLTTVWNNLCGDEIVKVVVSGSAGAIKTVTGTIGGTAEAAVSGSAPYQVNSNSKYIQLQLADGFYFKPGDLVRTNATTAMYIYTGAYASRVELAKMPSPVGGQTYYVLPETLPENTNIISVTDKDEFDGKISTIAVDRLCDNEYILEYEMNEHGNLIPMAYNVNTLPNPLPSPVADGLTFGGWYYDNNVWQQPASSGSAMTGNTVLYAKWDERERICTKIYDYLDRKIDGTFNAPRDGVPTSTTKDSKTSYDDISMVLAGDEDNTYTLFDAGSDVNGINSVSIKNAYYDNKVTGDNDPSHHHITSYLKMRTGTTELKIDMRVAGYLVMKVGGYDKSNTTVKVTDATSHEESLTSDGKAIIEDNFHEMRFALTAGINTVTVSGANAYISYMEVCNGSSEAICEAPNITAQPASQSVILKVSPNPTMTVTVDDETDVTYRWYTCASNGGSMEAVVANATANTKSLEVVPQVVGTTFYKCVITKTCGENTVKLESGLCFIDVKPADVTMTYELYHGAEDMGAEFSNFTQSLTINNPTVIDAAEEDWANHGATIVDRKGYGNDGAGSKLMTPSFQLPTNVDAENNYLSFSFDVISDNYMIISNINAQVQPVTNDGSNFWMVMTDQLGQTLTGTIENAPGGRFSSFQFAAADLENSHMTGHVTVKIYGENATSTAFRFHRNLTITGTVTSLPAAEIHWVTEPQNGCTGDALTIAAASEYECDGCYTISYESLNTAVATVDAETGAMSYRASGTADIVAHITGDGLHFRTNGPGTTLTKTITVNQPKIIITGCDMNGYTTNSLDLKAVLLNDHDIPGGTTIAWYRDHNLIQGATSATYHATENGVYYVKCGGVQSANEVEIDNRTPNTFQTAGNWNTAANWSAGHVPAAEEKVQIEATCTITSDDIVAKTVMITPNAELVVEEGAELNITHDLIFMYNNDGQVGVAKIDGTVNATNTYLDMNITSAAWHSVSLPSEVHTDNVIVDGVDHKFYNATGWYLRAFDGIEFSKYGPSTNSKGGKLGWYNVRSATTMNANTGYLVGLGHSDSEIHILRFPISLGDQKADKNGAINLTSPTGTQGDRYKGWNYVGIPYVSGYKQEEYGHYNLEIVTYSLINSNTNYRQVWLGDITLKPFTGYFFQVGAALAMDFEEENRSLINQPVVAPVAARVATNNTEMPSRVSLILSNEAGEKDETSLALGDEFTTNYEFGREIVKMFGEGYTKYSEPAVYTKSQIGDMAISALPYSAAQMIPVGFYAAAEGTYTFSLNEKRDMSGLQAVYLIDDETGAMVNLMLSDYEFQTSRQANNNDRFYLSIVKKSPTITTGVDNDNDNDKVEKVIINGRLYILKRGHLYDAQGKMVK